MEYLNNPLIIVDGSSYLYRAYYVFPYLTNDLGEHTGAIYGVLNMLRQMILKYRPSHFVIVFDAKEKNFRKKIFSEYKANRSPMPNQLETQIKPLFSIIKAIGLPLIIISGVEADDVIGTLACKIGNTGKSVVISTNDKDMAQLVTKNINLINTITNRIIGPKEVKDKYGVPPEFIVDLLALMGDYSDNIPGVPGIGKKTAQLLLSKIGGIDSIYSHLNELNNINIRGAQKIVNMLKEHKKTAYCSYYLAKIKTDVAITISYDQMKIHSPDVKKLLYFFERYQFKKWIKDIENQKWPAVL